MEHWFQSYSLHTIGGFYGVLLMRHRVKELAP